MGVTCSSEVQDTTPKTCNTVGQDISPSRPARLVYSRHETRECTGKPEGSSSSDESSHSSTVERRTGASQRLKFTLEESINHLSKEEFGELKTFTSLATTMNIDFHSYVSVDEDREALLEDLVEYDCADLDELKQELHDLQERQNQDRARPDHVSDDYEKYLRVLCNERDGEIHDFLQVEKKFLLAFQTILTPKCVLPLFQELKAKTFANDVQIHKDVEAILKALHVQVAQQELESPQEDPKTPSSSKDESSNLASDSEDSLEHCIVAADTVPSTGLPKSSEVQDSTMRRLTQKDDKKQRWRHGEFQLPNGDFVTGDYNPERSQKSRLLTPEHELYIAQCGY